LTQLNKSS